METRISEGQILEFYGKAGDRLVLSAQPLSGREFLMARYASEAGPHPQQGKSWSTSQCLCLGERRAVVSPSRNHSNSYMRFRGNANNVPVAYPDEGNEMIFPDDGLILVEFPPKGHLFGANIVRIDADGVTYPPDGVREKWAGDAV